MVVMTKMVVVASNVIRFVCGCDCGSVYIVSPSPAPAPLHASRRSPAPSAPSLTAATTTDAYTVTNNTSNATVDLSIISGNSADWTAKDTAGAEEFAMKAELEIGGMTAIDTSQTLAEDVAAGGGTHAFDLGFDAPTSTAHAGVQQSITVTISSAIAS